MADERAGVANLNYWAYWIGELSDDQTSDVFMLDDDTRAWSGVQLLRHLTNRLTPDSLHLPLNLCTLHALIASRPPLLDRRPSDQARLAEVLDSLTSVGGLTRTSRDQLTGLHYALRIAGR
ncbi:hypothetical protein EV193_106312 [Herbihabitans rhizosphaerae]|uniref:Uncharacterized protein n=2 Tax=Herbihabitans rhizosphaerae TaxID=1872711 RepID=A0A4Q7KLF0_9PSEU|nr:hypothetical protein EV193_106312 [Herbihabitans rhizosphaerae]